MIRSTGLGRTIVFVLSLALVATLAAGFATQARKTGKDVDVYLSSPQTVAMQVGDIVGRTTTGCANGDLSIGGDYRSPDTLLTLVVLEDGMVAPDLWRFKFRLDGAAGGTLAVEVRTVCLDVTP